MYRLTWRLPLAGLVVFSHLQFSQIRGRQPYSIVRKIPYLINRCRALATKIGNELRNKRPEHFVDQLSLADVHASLERAADVLSTVKGSQARAVSATDS